MAAMMIVAFVAFVLGVAGLVWLYFDEQMDDDSTDEFRDDRHWLDSYRDGRDDF